MRDTQPTSAELIDSPSLWQPTSPKERDAATRQLLSAANLAGVYYPLARDANGYMIARVEPSEDPIPPVHLQHWYGWDGTQHRDDWYMNGGRDQANHYRKAVTDQGLDLNAGPILDYGCSAGRVVRWFKEETEHVEVWGADIDGPAIAWAKLNLPKFNFVLNTTTPHLPFSDGYFNFIFAGSVFTHIGDLDDMWFLELRRILSPTGMLCITIADQEGFDSIKEGNQLTVVERTRAVADYDHPDVVKIVDGNSPWVQNVFYDRAWLIAQLEKWFTIHSAVNGLKGWQSGLVLGRKS